MAVPHPAPPSDVPTGVLLANLGSPEAPTTQAVRVYLKQFLSDRRVVNVPRPIWWALLNFWILPRRAPKSAALYEKIWTPQGSPLLVFSTSLAEKFAGQIARAAGREIPVALGMRYGKPSLEDALETLRRADCRRLLVFPLYPQYAAATTASVFDEIARALKARADLPECRFVNDYHDRTEYVAALACSLEAHWESRGRPDKLLFSFHGLPRRSVRENDPYFYQCHATARLTAARLDLPADKWALAFQSRFGGEEWLKPDTAETLHEWGRAKIKTADVICPGFAADCLETLEEIAQRGRETFLEAGGGEMRYIPALSDSETHAEALAAIAFRHMKDW